MRTVGSQARVSTAFLLLLLVPCARAADRYVDAQAGSNSNDGAGPATAWRTLTFAVSQLQTIAGSPHLIHVGPGIYDAALGEQFPIAVRSWIQIVGTQGSAATILDGGGATILSYRTSPSEPDMYGPASITAGLTLRNGSTGISIVSSGAECSPVFHDMHISGMSQAGVWVRDSGAGSHVARPVFTGTDFDTCTVGIRLDAGSAEVPPGGTCEASLTDGRISGCSVAAIEMHAFTVNNVALWLERIRVTDNAGFGIHGHGTGQASITAISSLLALNHQAGIELLPANGFLLLVDCTVAANAGAGVRATSATVAQLRNSIFHGNANDLELAGAILSANHCQSGDGDLNGQPACFGADPLFVAPSARDFRLRFGSPCIDSGDPASPPTALDLEARPRRTDGDLDTQERPDRGCLEFLPLGLSTAGQLGAPVRLEMWGEMGGSTILYFTRQAPVPPIPTVFGALELAPSSLGTLLTGPVAPFPPVAFQRPIPNNPFFVGRTFTFQALTTSSLAPAGSAYTNAVSLTIVP
jgi:hypothetical protein